MAHMSMKFVHSCNVFVKVFALGLEMYVCHILVMSDGENMKGEVTLLIFVGTNLLQARGGGVSMI